MSGTPAQPRSGVRPGEQFGGAERRRRLTPRAPFSGAPLIPWREAISPAVAGPLQPHCYAAPRHSSKSSVVDHDQTFTAPAPKDKTGCEPSLLPQARIREVKIRERDSVVSAEPPPATPGVQHRTDLPRVRNNRATRDRDHKQRVRPRRRRRGRRPAPLV